MTPFYIPISIKVKPRCKHLVYILAYLNLPFMWLVDMKVGKKQIENNQ